MEWKLYASWLFDLVNDSGETRDVSAENPEIAAFLKAERDKLFETGQAASDTDRVKLDKETERALKSQDTLIRAVFLVGVNRI